MPIVGVLSLIIVTEATSSPAVRRAFGIRLLGLVREQIVQGMHRVDVQTMRPAAIFYGTTDI
jgi:hypothetical protein